MKRKAQNPVSQKDSLADFRARCHQSNLRITPQRTAVYEQLVRTKQHPSANMVFHRVRRKFPNISLDTVNRTLLTFAEIGLAFSVPGTGDARRFDGDLQSHQHFRCLKCRKIIDFVCPAFDNIKLPRKVREKFTVISKTVYLEGICDKCRPNKSLKK